MQGPYKIRRKALPKGGIYPVSQAAHPGLRHTYSGTKAHWHKGTILEAISSLCEL